MRDYTTEIKKLPKCEIEEWFNITGEDVIVSEADQQAFERLFNGEEPNSEKYINPKIEGNKKISFLRFGKDSETINIIIEGIDVSIPLEAFNKAAKFLNYQI